MKFATARRALKVPGTSLVLTLFGTTFVVADPRYTGPTKLVPRAIGIALAIIFSHLGTLTDRDAVVQMTLGIAEGGGVSHCGGSKAEG